jgi:hypothetical protein
MPQVRAQWPASLNTALSLRVAQNVESFFTASGTVAKDSPDISFHLCKS